jgi:hypothetical protein
VTTVIGATATRRHNGFGLSPVAVVDWLEISWATVLEPVNKRNSRALQRLVKAVGLAAAVDAARFVDEFRGHPVPRWRLGIRESDPTRPATEHQVRVERVERQAHLARLIDLVDVGESFTVARAAGALKFPAETVKDLFDSEEGRAVFTRTGSDGVRRCRPPSSGQNGTVSDAFELKVVRTLSAASGRP